MTHKELQQEYAHKIPAILCDFDGTLSLRGERKPYDWSRVGEDMPNLPVVFFIQRLQLFATVIILSARDESCRWQSEMWLTAQNIFPHAFFMRQEKDNRDDTIVKKEIYEREIRDKYNVLAVIDDRPRVVRLWRELGLFVFDVNHQGEF